MDRTQSIIEDLKDIGVSGEYDENPVTRAELARILEILVSDLRKD